MTAAEVIDLTGLSSSPPVYSNDQMSHVGRATEQPTSSAIDKDTAVSTEDGELPRVTKPTMPTPQKQRKRKKSQQDPAITKEEKPTTTDKRRRQGDERNDALFRGRSRSPPDRATRRRALHEMSSESLFFVDDKPVDIRDSYAPTTLAGPSRAQKNSGLVLPPHVNVADGSSESQAPSLPPPSDPEEGEDFIDYLDVDGDRSVCISLTESLSLCTLIQRMKSQKIGVTRYFHDTREIDTKTRFVCKNCGEEGNHKAKDCPHQIVRTFILLRELCLTKHSA